MTYQVNGGSASQNGEGDLQNDERTSSQIDTTVTQPRSRPVRYQIIDKDGHSWAEGTNAQQLVALAKKWWPDQEQDEERSGRGWDVQAIGAE